MSDRLRKFKVGTFYSQTGDAAPRLSQIRCYTLWFNSQWSGCVIFDVEARTGVEAKKIARQLRYELEVKG